LTVTPPLSARVHAPAGLVRPLRAGRTTRRTVVIIPFLILCAWIFVLGTFTVILAMGLTTEQKH
jgi:hypothetical protein